ncbi:hypothetical protein VP01_92g1 [Puccinia sorghi]|uniref:Uncharacterized protein n=1 Tax=Puccinia sorghi TaxID=27349 RepID=A0A0L6U714_9BASI|nr:hypothetical protein VP01_92g1 [Puccinia sorghi]
MLENYFKYHKNERGFKPFPNKFQGTLKIPWSLILHCESEVKALFKPELKNVKANTENDEKENLSDTLGSSCPKVCKAAKIVANNFIMGKDLSGMEKSSHKYYKTKKAKLFNRMGIS